MKRKLSREEERKRIVAKWLAWAAETARGSDPRYTWTPEQFSECSGQMLRELDAAKPKRKGGGK